MKDAIQEQLIAARRSQILDAAVTVFAQKGFHPTTIRDIAREAGIADGTVYNYFDNKTALLLGIFDRLNETDQRAESFSDPAETDFRSFMKAYFRHRLSVIELGNFEAFRVVLSEIMVNAELRALYHDRILAPTFAMAETHFQTLAAHHLIKSREIGLTMRAVSGMMLGIIIERMMGDQTLATQWDDLPDFLTDLILDGIGSDKS
ncbi:MAG: TetR/AcrR family transcriptional regulator [Chloroflexota bacterium]